MPEIFANVPPIVTVPLSGIARGSAFRQGSNYYVALSDPSGGSTLCAPLGGGAAQNILSTSQVEVVRIDSVNVTVSPTD